MNSVILFLSHVVFKTIKQNMWWWVLWGVGAIISLGGTTVLTYAWGLGVASKNVVKAYALMQRLKLAIEANIHFFVSLWGIQGSSLAKWSPKLVLLIILLMQYLIRLKIRS